MRSQTTLVAALIVALLLSFPTAVLLADRSQELNIERSKNDGLNLQIDTIENKRLQEKQELEKRNEELQKQLQAKTEAKQQEEQKKVAQAATVKQVSPGGAEYSGGGNCEQYRPLVAQYSWNVDTAMRVMKAESGCNPNAANNRDNHHVCMGSFGLFQISCHGGKIFDPAQNVAAAWAKYQARGWQPWGVCTSGKVRCV